MCWTILAGHHLHPLVPSGLTRPVPAVADGPLLTQGLSKSVSGSVRSFQHRNEGFRALEQGTFFEVT